MQTNARREERLNKNPLLAFSDYTDTYFKIVTTLGREIIECLEAERSPEPEGRILMRCDGLSIDASYGKFWLWLLGAYEIVRTMCQASQCFSDRINPQLKNLKNKLTLLRVPFAKQRLPGKAVPVHAEPSPCTILASTCDYIYRVKNNMLSVRELIGEFDAVLGGIKRSDVLADHRTSYPPAIH